MAHHTIYELQNSFFLFLLLLHITTCIHSVSICGTLVRNVNIYTASRIHCLTAHTVLAVHTILAVHTGHLVLHMIDTAILFPVLFVVETYVQVQSLFNVPIASPSCACHAVPDTMPGEHIATGPRYWPIRTYWNRKGQGQSFGHVPRHNFALLTINYLPTKLIIEGFGSMWFSLPGKSCSDLPGNENHWTDQAHW